MSVWADRSAYNQPVSKVTSQSESGAKQRLLLIDGHSMAYRAFYALPVENFATSSGQPTNAIYGFTSMLLNLIRDESPTHIAVAFDVSRKTFRSEKFPDYKAQRAKTPDEFRSQLDYIHQMVAALGIKSFSIQGFEADDIIATISKDAVKKGMEVLICTGDRDAFQLINDKITDRAVRMLMDRSGLTDYDKAKQLLLERGSVRNALQSLGR